MTHEDPLYQYCRRHNVVPSQVIKALVFHYRLSGLSLDVLYWQHLN